MSSSSSGSPPSATSSSSFLAINITYRCHLSRLPCFYCFLFFEIPKLFLPLAAELLPVRGPALPENIWVGLKILVKKLNRFRVWQVSAAEVQNDNFLDFFNLFIPSHFCEY